MNLVISRRLMDRRWLVIAGLLLFTLVVFGMLFLLFQTPVWGIHMTHVTHQVIIHRRAPLADLIDIIHRR